MANHSISSMAGRFFSDFCSECQVMGCHIEYHLFPIRACTAYPTISPNSYIEIHKKQRLIKGFCNDIQMSEYSWGKRYSHYYFEEDIIGEVGVEDNEAVIEAVRDLQIPYDLGMPKEEWLDRLAKHRIYIID